MTQYTDKNKMSDLSKAYAVSAEESRFDKFWNSSICTDALRTGDAKEFTRAIYRAAERDTRERCAQKAKTKADKYRPFTSCEADAGACQALDELAEALRKVEE